MARIEPTVLTFNTGIVDQDKLHRTDLGRVGFAAETQTNLLGEVTGAMFMRPGFEYIGATDSNNQARIWGYFKSVDDQAVLEFTDTLMRVWVDDSLVTRASVTSSVSNNDFSAGTGWTLSGGAAIDTTKERLEMKADAKGVSAIAKQQVSTSTGGTEHALRIVITSGTVRFRCGSSDGDDDYISDTKLRPGTHSIAFTPSGSYWVQFQVEYDTEYAEPKYVDSISVESSGTMTLPTSWSESDLSLLRFDQSLDVIFVAARGYRQKRIERRGDNSWSIVDYETTDGPYSLIRTQDVTLSMATFVSTSDAPGDYGLVASLPFFTSGHVGALFKFYVRGLSQDVTVGAEGQFTEPFRVTGVNATNYNDRDWTYTTTGTWSGTLTIQRNFDGPDEGYTDFRNSDSVSTIGFSSNVSGVTNDDDDDNTIAWYRIGFKDGEYISGSAKINFLYDGILFEVIARVIAISSSTLANIEFVDRATPLIGSIPIDDWVELEWSSTNGFPSAVGFHDGRLGWSGQDKFWLSVSDNYHSFDAEFEGDAGPINRAIAVGGSSDAQWMLSLNELIIGTNANIVSVKASTQGEIITPSNTTVKRIAGSVGCKAISPVQIGNEGIFADASGKALYVLQTDGISYSAREISKLTTNIYSSGIEELAYQRAPDPRIWAVTTDGDLICCLYDPANEILGFYKCETDGDVESVTVVRNATQDDVYISVKRTINSSTVRYIEKMALDSETTPDTLCKCVDSFLVATASGTTLSGLSHLEAETVVVWSNGEPLLDSDDDPQTFTVSSGAITLPASAADTQCVVGLQYTARYKSGRLGYGVNGYNALMKNKRLVSLGLLMTDFVRAGVKIGSEFDNANHPLDPLRTERNGTTADAIVLDDVQDEEPFAVEGAFDLDSRVCVEVKSPNTAKFLAMNLGLEV